MRAGSGVVVAADPPPRVCYRSSDQVWLTRSWPNEWCGSLSTSGSRRARRSGARARACRSSTASARGSPRRGRRRCTRRRAGAEPEPARPRLDEQQPQLAPPRRSRARRAREPAGAPSSSAIQAGSRAGSCASAKSATMPATSRSKLPFQPYSCAYSSPWRCDDPAEVAGARGAQDEHGGAAPGPGAAARRRARRRAAPLGRGPRARRRA